MGSNDDPSETTNRRSVLKAVSAGALATVAGGGVVAADRLSANDDGVGAAECLNPTYQYQCVDSGCECDDPCTNCECDTKEQERLVCQDRYGNVTYHPWYDTGNCCTSC